MLQQTLSSHYHNSFKRKYPCIFNWDTLCDPLKSIWNCVNKTLVLPLITRPTSALITCQVAWIDHEFILCKTVWLLLGLNKDHDAYNTPPEVHFVLWGFADLWVPKRLTRHILLPWSFQPGIVIFQSLVLKRQSLRFPSLLVPFLWSPTNSLPHSGAHLHSLVLRGPLVCRISWVRPKPLGGAVIDLSVLFQGPL